MQLAAGQLDQITRFLPRQRGNVSMSKRCYARAGPGHGLCAGGAASPDMMFAAFITVALIAGALRQGEHDLVIWKQTQPFEWRQAIAGK